MLKRLKNIDDKTDNKLDLIRDQESKQLNRISKITSEKITKFFSEKSKILGDEIKKKIKENDKKNFVYIAADNTPFSFAEYNLRLMGNKFYTGDLTLDEAKDDQETMLKKN